MPSPLHVSSGPTSSLLTKRSLLSCRLPEPLEPDDDVAEYGMVEGATEAFRAHLPELKEWTHFPEEGITGSVGLLDGIKTYAAHVDSTDARCGSVCALGVVDRLGSVGRLGLDQARPWMWIGWDLWDVDPLVS